MSDESQHGGAVRRRSGSQGKERGLVRERRKEFATWERRERVSGMGSRNTKMCHTIGQRGCAVRSALVAGDRAGGVWYCDVKGT